MNISVYFKIIRWKNLLIIAYTIYLLKFHLFSSFNISTKLTLFQFLLLLFSILFITAAGYIINDIYDVNGDLINKPKKVIVSKIISIEKAKKWYLFTNTIGIILGIFFCLQLKDPRYVFIFIATSFLLYYYAKKLKGIAFIGNFIISFLIALSFSLVALFDINFEIKNSMHNVVIVVLGLLFLFAFCINFIREIVKDIEDINGDNHSNLNTLPIIFGRNRIRNLAMFLCLFPIFLLIFIILKNAETYKITSIYLLFFTFIPLLYVFIKLRNSTTTKQFQQISLLLKLIMILGVNSILIFSIFH
jgi:4-hydroxybenzoate polyprenyltransferase